MGILRNFVVAILASLVILLLTVPVFGQDTQSSEDLPIATILGENGAQPHIVTDGQGRWVVVWIDSSNEIVIVRSEDHAKTWSSPSIPPTLLGHKVDYEGVEIATDNAGKWLMVWIDAQDGFLRFSSSNDHAHTWSSPQLLFDPSEHASDYPLADALGLSSVEIAYGGGRWAVLVQNDGFFLTFSDDLLTWSKSTTIISDGNLLPSMPNVPEATFEFYGDNSRFALAADGRGNWIIGVSLWVQSSDSFELCNAFCDSIAEDLVVTWRSSDNGETWLRPNYVYRASNGNSLVKGEADFLELASDESGQWLAVWSGACHRRADWFADSVPCEPGWDNAINGAVFIARTENNGESWQVPTIVDLVDDFGVIRGFPAQLQYREDKGEWALIGYKAGYMHSFYSSDSGRTWPFVESVALDGVPAISQEGEFLGVLNYSPQPSIATVDMNWMTTWYRSSNGEIVVQGKFDGTAPVGGTAESATGPYTADNTRLAFTWQPFSDPESRIIRHEVALGTTENPQAFHAFTVTSVALETSATLCVMSSPEACDVRLALEGNELPQGEYLFSVRAINSAGLASVAATTTVTVDATAYRVGAEIPLPEGKTWEGIDWTKTTMEPPTHVFRIEHAQKVLVSDYFNESGRSITINWHFTDTTTLSRQYKTASEPVQDEVVIYYTYDGATHTTAPPVDLSGIPSVTIHYNDAIPNMKLVTDEPDQRHLWLAGKTLHARSQAKDLAYVVLEYNSIAGGTPTFLGIEVVRVSPNNDTDVPTGEVHVGSRLLPYKPIANATAKIMQGHAVTGTVSLVYQHAAASPQQDEIWAIKPNAEAYKVEIMWQRPGLGGVLWPFELRRYTATWPDDAPHKYQLHVMSDTPDAPGPGVEIPATLQAQIVHAADTQARLVSDTFSTQSPGWTLLKYQTQGGQWVGFEVVKTVLNTDAEVETTQPQSWAIGTEITDTEHLTDLLPIVAGYTPGYIHDPQADDKYDPVIYATGTPTGTGQIFAVNEGELEVWWYQQSRSQDPEGEQWPAWPAERVHWPYKVMHYETVWPERPEQIIIARTSGSGNIDPDIYGRNSSGDWSIYWQNDPALPGFNPNDEHALAQDETVFALRDDLGREATSEPYVLMKYKEQSVDEDHLRWRYRIFAVVAEQEPYFFHEWANFTTDANHEPGTDPYEKVAGDRLQPFAPLYTLGECQESAGVSGPFFEDRKQEFWIKAAGDDLTVNGGAAEVTMRYYYPVQPSFYFPSGSAPAVGTCIPLLPDNNGLPVEVVYTVTWPENVPTLNLNEMLIRQEKGLPTLENRFSVDILYQQSEALGEGASATLVDPIHPHVVTLAQLPGDDIETLREGDIHTFITLGMTLRQRLSYNAATQQLSFQGVPNYIPENDLGYAISNIMSESEHQLLRKMSQDPAWEEAIDDLYAAARAPVAISDGGVMAEMKALSTSAAQSTGYVTLLFENHAEAPTERPVEVKVIRVAETLDTGVLIPLEAPCPFDETITMWHLGDFGARIGDYEFEWQYRPAAGGAPPMPPDEASGWLVPPGLVAPTIGVGEVTIRGANILTLSDNYLAVRYKYVGPDDVPLKGQWSQWTEPQLAEGWIKRVLGGIGPFEQRPTGKVAALGSAEEKYGSYGEHGPNTMVTMIGQAGKAWVGDIPLNCTALDSYGLLELYGTVFNRGKLLSIDGDIDDDNANQALLLVASRISDLYMLLGNEAYADAADPTIAFGSGGYGPTHDYAAEATSLHAFMNVTGSLLEEELALLRGRDDTVAPGAQNAPYYNRLIWNFTNDITGGEVAYALNYNIRDESGDANGEITAADAAKLYPQGHGDAWGHYLTALQNYYQLLRHPNYSWEMRQEEVLIGISRVFVDFLDERKFAAAAAAKARTGAEIVNLTYREHYVEDPAEQWQGYRDDDSERAWGVAEWGSRAGQGAYLDWVVANAILPAEDTNPAHTGIQKVDRSTVLELREIASHFDAIQMQIDMADLGLNPLGLATNVIPFDIDPQSFAAGQTHFEQIYQRAVASLNNSMAVFDHATNSTQRLRGLADDAAAFSRTVVEREADYQNRLIEIYGYPYPEDKGPGKLYASNYDGYDKHHYMYVDATELTGAATMTITEVPLTLTSYTVGEDGSLQPTSETVTYHFAGNALYTPVTWSGKRKAPGEIQLALSDLLQLKGRFEGALVEYENLLASIEAQAEFLQVQHAVNAEQIKLLDAAAQEQEQLDSYIRRSRAMQLAFETSAGLATLAANAMAEALPTSAGTSVDATAPARSAVLLMGNLQSESLMLMSNVESLNELGHQQAAQAMQAQTHIELTALNNDLIVQQLLSQLEQTIRQEYSRRLELYTLHEAVLQSIGRYRAVLMRGERLKEEYLRFQSQTAALVQTNRYHDMAFRLFRNEALQKYRAQFDLAARYVYLAAKAYDYETTLLSSDPRAGEAFLTDIVRQRSLGMMHNLQPQEGSGLADKLFVMMRNFEVVEGQFGINNPQEESYRFSLRWELFRIGNNGEADDAQWRQTLQRYYVPNLRDLPAYQRYASPLVPQLPQEPGIVIPFQTMVKQGSNFFGLPGRAGDNPLNSASFTTKLYSVGVKFHNYNLVDLYNTPVVYLIPVGVDVQRSPTGSGEQLREFTVLDQVLPPPYPLTASALNEPTCLPIVDGVESPLDTAAVRRYDPFRAYHNAGFQEEEMSRDNRLIGRSVWNTQWLLIIPAGGLLADRDEGLKRFIGDGASNQSEGVADIYLYLETYAYPGN